MIQEPHVNWINPWTCTVISFIFVILLFRCVTQRDTVWHRGGLNLTPYRLIDLNYYILMKSCRLWEHFEISFLGNCLLSTVPYLLGMLAKLGQCLLVNLHKNRSGSSSFISHFLNSSLTKAVSVDEQTKATGVFGHFIQGSPLTNQWQR